MFGPLSCFPDNSSETDIESSIGEDTHNKPAKMSEKKIRFAPLPLPTSTRATRASQPLMSALYASLQSLCQYLEEESAASDIQWRDNGFLEQCFVQTGIALELLRKLECIGMGKKNGICTEVEEELSEPILCPPIPYCGFRKHHSESVTRTRKSVTPVWNCIILTTTTCGWWKAPLLTSTPHRLMEWNSAGNAIYYSMRKEM
ncbi:hypothetical protein TNIN_343851 [Trichonephila inaurata madagascariensis]|uniref:Uncharacterized protein n=1 Tax=Trichonephila inaurata madagascariensis TaxID=2747483 RepID=A0A8X7BQS2_9ARAC|nr:hypothetical protein TNIN_343851 [Trichonephila inaurata madagascariensis]